jgi:hypothetical protein
MRAARAIVSKAWVHRLAWWDELEEMVAFRRRRNHRSHQQFQNETVA